MKISILSPDLSNNCVGRAYLLAKVLMRRYDVEVIGPAYSGDVWLPCRSLDVEYKKVRGRNFPMFITDARRILSLVEGDILYALKPLLPSFGIGIMAKLRLGLPLILDIDDWEVGAYLILSKLRLSRCLLTDLRKPTYSFSFAVILERLIPMADAVTVSSTFLARRFGGTLVPHGRDTKVFDPSRFDESKLREEEDLHGKKVVMFLGSPREHKGIEDLVEAVRLLDRNDTALVIVGCNFAHPYTQALAGSVQDVARMVSMIPFADAPRFLAMADVVVIPQRDEPYSRAQVPAKVFDAMCMAKPVVSTNVSDIPAILDGAGVIVEPRDVHGLAQAIQGLLEDSDRRTELGRRGRERCLKEYSWDVMEATLAKVIGDLGC